MAHSAFELSRCLDGVERNLKRRGGVRYRPSKAAYAHGYFDDDDFDELIEEKARLMEDLLLGRF